MIKIALIAGEPSGDQLGAWLMDALRSRALEEGQELCFVGIGGTMMQERGLSSWVPIKDLSVNGLTEVIRHIPTLKRHISETAERLKQEQPNILVTIDAPGFCHRVSKKLRADGFNGKAFPLIHYVAPTVWAWKPKRAAKIAKFLDHLLVLLPFEPPYFEREGLKTTFIGHPVLRRAKAGDANRFFEANGLDQSKPILLVLPGSRGSEVKNLLPVYIEALKQIPEEVLSTWQLVVPLAETVKTQVTEELAASGLSVLSVEGDQQRWDAYAAASMALATSGTVSVELAASRTPVVVAYQASRLTAFLIKKLVKVRFASLLNILADRDIQPEYLYENCQPEKIAKALEGLLASSEARSEQVAAVEQVLAKMKSPDAEGPSAAAARIVWSHIQKQPQSES